MLQNNNDVCADNNGVNASHKLCSQLLNAHTIPVRVRRVGEARSLPVAELVAGDVLLWAAGDVGAERFIVYYTHVIFRVIQPR